MAFSYGYRCPACRHGWEVARLLANLGQAVLPRSADEFRDWQCPGCVRYLSIVRVTDLASWLAWREGSSLSPYLREIADRIEACLAGFAPEAPIPIDLHPGMCPRCRMAFEENPEERFMPPPCPRCGVRMEDDPAVPMSHYLLAGPDRYGFW